MDVAAMPQALVDEWQRIAIIGLFAVGLVLTGIGLIGAVRSASSTLGRLERNLTDVAAVNKRHADQVRLADFGDNHDGGPVRGQERAYYEDKEWSRARIKDERERALRDILGDTFPNDDSASTAVAAQVAIVRMLVDSNRSNAWLLGVGIVVETVASVWALYV